MDPSEPSTAQVLFVIISGILALPLAWIIATLIERHETRKFRRENPEYDALVRSFEKKP